MDYNNINEATFQVLYQRNHQFQEKIRGNYWWNWKKGKLEIKKFPKTTRVDEPEPLVQSKQEEPEQCQTSKCA